MTTNLVSRRGNYNVASRQGTALPSRRQPRTTRSLVPSHHSLAAQTTLRHAHLPSSQPRRWAPRESRRSLPKTAMARGRGGVFGSCACGRSQFQAPLHMGGVEMPAPNAGRSPGLHLGADPRELILIFPGFKMASAPSFLRRRKPRRALRLGKKKSGFSSTCTPDRVKTGCLNRWMGDPAAADRAVKTG